MFLSFNQFIKEDFNSSGAQQFLISVSKTKSAKNTNTKEIMLFYEHVKGSSINLTRYSQSFLSSNVSELMKAPSNDYRFLFYCSNTGFDIFVWHAETHHSAMSRALDANKHLNKYPSTIKYNYLYNECQMYMKGDEIGSYWCFPLVVFENNIVLNLSVESLGIIHSFKNIKDTFQLNDLQWKNLTKKLEYPL